MITFETMPAAECNDADLVAASLKGNRDAFRQIVERYQTLISSLGYSATGNVALSEDLAQETFVTAWKRLAALREPAKLRAWLCGINRFLISKEFRRLDREPVHAAESLEAVDEWTSPEPLPPDHAISDEEKAILWRSLERIPELYREPMVLFYREQQSIEVVARNLDLSPDAVKQRLVRGRKLLHRQVVGFVEAALARTKPDQAFTLGVLAALPLMVTTAKAATAGVAIKGGSTVKAATSLAMLGAVLTGGALFLFSLLGFFAFTGACLGCMMGRACKRSARDLQHVVACWRMLALGFLGLVVPVVVASLVIPQQPWYQTYFSGATRWLGLIYPLVAVALIIWLVRWRLGWRHGNGEKGAVDQLLKRRFLAWFALGLLVPGILCAYYVYAMAFRCTWTAQPVTSAQAQQMFASRQDAEVRLEEYAGGTKQLWIKLPESRRRVAFFTTVDDATLAALNQSGIHYETSVEGRDFVDSSLTWHGLLFLSLFVACMGAGVSASRPWRQMAFARSELELRSDERVAGNAFKALSVSVALVMLSVTVVLGLVTRWNVHRVSPAEVPSIVASLKAGEFEVYQYHNGTRELWICQQASRGHPSYIAPADAGTLALLEEKGFSYKTYVQGRDFGYGIPQPWLALVAMCVLGGGAGILLWRVSPKVIAVLVAGSMVCLGLMLGLVTPWKAATITKAAAQTMMTEHPRDRFEIKEYNNGAHELWITPHGGLHYPAFIAPADDSTLTQLAENKIQYQTSIQGRDFGYGLPTRGSALMWLSGFAAIGGLSIWLAWRKQERPALRQR
jgi:RNA polymerase sigma factor (sigma-70 family)